MHKSQMFLMFFQARLASAAELETVHSPKHIKFMSSLHSKKPRELQGMQNSFESIFFHRQTNNAALLASGSLLEVSRIYNISILLIHGMCNVKTFLYAHMKD